MARWTSFISVSHFYFLQVNLSSVHQISPQTQVSLALFVGPIPAMACRQELSFKLVMYPLFSQVTIERPLSNPNRKICFHTPLQDLFSREDRRLFHLVGDWGRYKLRANPNNIHPTPSSHHSWQMEHRPFPLI